jgi:hypothetical protein
MSRKSGNPVFHTPLLDTTRAISGPEIHTEPESGFGDHSKNGLWKIHVGIDIGLSVPP